MNNRRLEQRHQNKLYEATPLPNRAKKPFSPDLAKLENDKIQTNRNTLIN